MDGFVRPLPVCFDSQMSARFFKGYFHLPSFDKPFHYLLRTRCCLSAENGLRFKLAWRVSNYHPANRYCFFANVIPDTFATHKLNLPLLFAILIPQGDVFPLRFWIINDGLQRWSAFPFFARSAQLSFASRSCFSIQCRIQS